MKFSRKQTCIYRAGGYLDQIESLLGTLAIFVFGFFLFKRAITLQKRLRLVQDTPRSKTETAAQGFIELEGFAWPSSDCVKNIRQQDSIYYHFQLQREETRGSGKNKQKVWVTVSEFKLSSPFYICDATGLALVDPANAEFEMVKKETRSWSFLSESEKEYVSKVLVKDSVSGFPPGKFLFGLFSSKFQVIEQYILSGNPIYVAGDFRTPESYQKNISRTGLSRFYDMVFDAQSRATKNLKTILDTNKDGKVSAEESLQGFARAADIAIKRSQLESLPEREFSLHGFMQSSDKHKLFIAAAHENILLEKMKHKPMMYLVGGAVAMTLSIVLLIPQSYLERSLSGTSSIASSTIDSSSSTSPGHFKSSSIKLDSGRLHSECIGNNLSSCQKLLQMRNELLLSDDHLKYYRYQACHLGDQSFCN